MKRKDHVSCPGVVAIFAFSFMVSGFVLDLLIQATGGEYLFSSSMDRIVYFFYKPTSLFLLGTLVGLLFTGIFKITERIKRAFGGGSERPFHREAYLSAFFVILIIGAFLSNNIMIQGGYKVSVAGNIATLCAALLATILVKRRFRYRPARKSVTATRRYLLVACLSLIYVGLVQVFWVVESDANAQMPALHTEPPSSEIQNDRPGDGTGVDNVIIVLIDTVRADHLSLYGYRRKTTPNIDQWAGRSGSVVFENAFTTKTKTSPAVASLFTGLYPDSHGVYYCAQWLADEYVTLAEILGDHGFRTASIVANGNASIDFNFQQGFDTHIYDFSDAEYLVDQSIGWLDGLREGERFFLYLHLIDPHTPYDPPQEYRSLFLTDKWSQEYKDWKVTVGSSYVEHIRDEIAISGHETDLDYYISMYDSEIRYTDDEVGRFLSYLDSSGLARNTLIILTADHGESMTEHNSFFHHGSFAYQPTAKIPLIMHNESFGEARRTTSLVSLADVMPTILDVLGVHSRQAINCEGKSLMPLPGDQGEQPQYVRIMGGDRHEWVILRAIYDGRWKLIYNPIGLSRSGLYNIFNTFYPRQEVEWLRRKVDMRATLLEYQLYDVENDPGEELNLVMKFPEETDRLKGVLRSRFSSGQISLHSRDIKTNSIDEKTLENLRSLGYLK